MLLVFTCVAAYMLQQKGLLTRETIDLLVKSRPEVQQERPAPVEPVGLAASVQKKERALREESERLERLSARLLPHARGTPLIRRARWRNAAGLMQGCSRPRHREGAGQDAGGAFALDRRVAGAGNRREVLA